METFALCNPAAKGRLHSDHKGKILVAMSKYRHGVTGTGVYMHEGTQARGYTCTATYRHGGIQARGCTGMAVNRHEGVQA